MNWKAGEPPKKRNSSYVFLIDNAGEPKIVSGSYRYGYYYEPAQNQIYWRADCCGRFIYEIVAWAPLPSQKKMWRLEDENKSDT
jgi:hypothetical protein